MLLVWVMLEAGKSGGRGELLETYKASTSYLLVLGATLRFRGSFSLPCHFNLTPTLMQVRLELRCRSRGNESRATGCGVGSRLSGGGWEGRLGLEGRSRENARWGRGLSYLPLHFRGGRGRRNWGGRWDEVRRREEQEEKEWIGPGKVLLLCGGVRGRGAERTFDRGKILVRGTPS